jgi:hypothetical protein
MSLAIEINRVAEVLIGGTWYRVEMNSESASTFVVDSFEFVPTNAPPIGDVPPGFGFMSNGQMIFGPLSAIQAVRYARAERPYVRATRTRGERAPSRTEYEATAGHASPTEDTKGNELGGSG